MVEKIKFLIIGSGPAGYTAAIYASRANLKPVMYQGIQPGGQLTTTTEVENFPGYPQGVTGSELMEALKNQALRFGTEIRDGMVTKVDFSRKTHKLTIDNQHEIEASAVIISTGATAKYLGIEAETKYAGMGVSACATCDGFFYRKKDVAVIGGGDTACEEAIYLSNLCNKVYLVVRKNFLRASKVMQERILKTSNIVVMFNHNMFDLLGKNGVEVAVLLNNAKNNEQVKIKVDGVFLAIGHQPNSEVFKPFIETDENGYIKTIKGSTRTNIGGVFACGDVQDPIYKQAITAAGSGCMAAIDAERYLNKR